MTYTFPNRYRCEDIQSYRLPAHPSTFWFNFRVVAYSEKGILLTRPIPIEIVVITADQSSHPIVPLRQYYPNCWYSTRWPIPAFQTTDESGVYLRIHVDHMGHMGHMNLRVELQGFDGAYPRAHHYILVDEEDRKRFLFSGPSGSIHEIEADGCHTAGLSPLEVDGVSLFPTAKQNTVYHDT